MVDAKALADQQKRDVAQRAASLVESGMVVGLGTGSTAAYVIEELGRRWRDEGLRFVAIPTSERSAQQATALGIELVTFATHPVLDIDIDGADEVQRGSLDLIKGLGGALLREKIVAVASTRFVVVADATKLVDHLGMHTPVPVEVTPFGWESTARHIQKLGARIAPRHDRSGVLYVTDGGNMILDCNFGIIENPAATERALREIVGVVETGLFISHTSEVIIATPDGVVTMRPE